MDILSLCLPPNVLAVWSVVPTDACRHSWRSSHVLSTWPLPVSCVGGQQLHHVSSTCPCQLFALPFFSFLAFASFPSFLLLLPLRLLSQMCRSGAFCPFGVFMGFDKFRQWHQVSSRFGRCSNVVYTNSSALSVARAVCMTQSFGMFFVW